MLYNLVLALAILIFTGCSSTAFVEQRHAFANANNAKVHLNHVPFIKQRTHHCGPATLTSVLRWSGSSISADQLAPNLYIESRKGSLQVEMLAAVRRAGFLAFEQKDEMAGLIRQLDNGVPVIVLLNLALKHMPSWHYAVVIGYDKAHDKIILHSGADASKTLPLKYFEFTWRKSSYWAMTIHKPNELPIGAREDDFIYAAHGLEIAGKKAEALNAYQLASTQWPENFIAWMGQGNIYYQEQKYNKAIEAYYAALDNSENDPRALHNLAWCHIKINRLSKALELAKQAQQYATIKNKDLPDNGSETLAVYQDTINKIYALKEKPL